MKDGYTLKVEAPAKVNLFLAIKGKRSDGYHELETVMQKVDLADRLYLKKVNAGVSIECKTSILTCPASFELPEDGTNIAHKAACAFFAKCAVDGGVDIFLEKNIPVAAGLGGGSSDAAAVLHGLNTLYAEPLNSDQLSEVALTLGADVPFFVSRDSAAFAGGIGEKLTKLSPLARCWMVLVNPGFAVSTKWVYDNFALTSGANPYSLGGDLPIGIDGLREMASCLTDYGVTRLYNDLEKVTMPEYPELYRIKDKLLSDGALFAMMSGSGPTLFALFDEHQKAESSYKDFKMLFPGVFVCKPL